MKNCKKCNKEDDELRTLFMSCFYDMDELDINFEKRRMSDNDIELNFYTLHVCKDCRSHWLKMIKAWYEINFKSESCGSGIFVREYGANIEITEEEWYKRNSDNKNVRRAGHTKRRDL